MCIFTYDMKTAVVSLCIVVIVLSEPLDDPPTKRETYLINTSNLNSRNVSFPNDKSCQRNGTSLYARYIEKRLDSIEDKTQRLLCEHLIDSSIYKALLGELTSNSEILESNEIRDPQPYVPAQELAAYANSDSTEMEYTAAPPPLISRLQVYTPLPQSESQPQPITSPPGSPTTSEPQEYMPTTTSESQPQPITSLPGSSTTSLPQKYTPSTTSESQVNIRSTTLEAEQRPLTSPPASSTASETPEYTPTPPPPMLQPQPQPMASPPASPNSFTDEELLMGPQTGAAASEGNQRLPIQCQSERATFVEERIFRDLRALKNNRQVQINIYCLSVKHGFISPDGVFNETAIKSRIQSFIKGNAVINKVYSTCDTKKTNKEETITYYWLCFLEFREYVFTNCVQKPYPNLSCPVKFSDKSSSFDCRIRDEKQPNFILCCDNC